MKMTLGTNPEDNDNVDVVSQSKESRIAPKYRHLIYHPFIDHIRITHYNYDPILEADIPKHLTAVRWMDGANRQLKRITSEKNIEFEAKRRIRCCKHSASRTAVKQAADTGPMFKAMKMVIKEMESPNSSTNRVYHYIDKELKKLHDSGELILPAHKKKAVLTTISKLPSVTGRFHSLSNVRKGFILNDSTSIINLSPATTISSILIEVM